MDVRDRLRCVREHYVWFSKAEPRIPLITRKTFVLAAHVSDLIVMQETLPIKDTLESFYFSNVGNFL